MNNGPETLRRNGAIANGDGLYSSAVRSAGSGSTWRRDPARVALLVPVVLGLAIYGPWLRPGWLLTYDWSSGPHDLVPPAVWGLSGGRGSVAPDVVARRLARHLTFGVDPIAVVLAASPLLVALGFRRLFPRRPVVWLSATVVTCVNPFVYERLASGAFGVVLGLVLLPLALAFALETGLGDVRAAARLALTLGAAIALSPQVLEFGPLVAGAGLAVGWHKKRAARQGDRDGRIRVVTASVVAVAGTMLLAASWLVPSAVFGYAQLDDIGKQDLAVYGSRATPHLGGITGTLLALYGFFRRPTSEPIDHVRGWPLILAAMGIAIIVGLMRGLWSDADRPLTIAVTVLGLVGLLLALGPRGPTGPAFTWLFNHSTLVRSLRDSEKALQLLVVAYALLFGLGAEWLAISLTGRSGLVLIAGVLLLPCLFSVTIFDGVMGFVRPSSYPVSWRDANDMMRESEGALLVLPWHEYLAYPWTQGRVVDNPARFYFSVPTITGDNIEAGSIETESSVPRSRELQFLFSVGDQTQMAGRLLAPLGIHWIMLSTEADYRQYAWLDDQHDIKVAARWPDAVLYENTEPIAPGWFVHASATVPGWGALVGAAASAPLTDYRIVVTHARPGPVRPFTLPPAGPAIPARASDDRPYEEKLRPISGVHSATAGLVTTLSYEPGWSVNGTSSVPSAGVTVSTPVVGTSGPVMVVQEHWELALACEVTSLVCLLVLAILAAPSVRLRHNRGPTPPQPRAGDAPPDQHAATRS